MKAVVYTRYGTPDVLRLGEVEKPVPKDNEVLVKVMAASINYIDLKVLTGKSLFIRLMTGGLFRPRRPILGDDVAGQVEAVGRDVKQFRPDDEVMGFCNFGGFAEYCCVKENLLALKPKKMSFQEAAAIPEASIPALAGLRDKGKIRPGQKVLIIGASGGVGMFAVQIAKAFGTDVTGVCSTKKVDMVRSIGADRVIDYTKEDFAQNGQQYDLILAAGGNHSIFDYRRVLTDEGIYVCVGGSMTQYAQAMFFGPLISIVSKKKIGTVFAPPNRKDYAFLTELFEEGKLVPVVDRSFPLCETGEAFRYYGEGNTQGKVVITMEPDNKA
jgi:NADPH:quinone reductase-like Zn-dependent oxidoreductase